MGKTVKKIHKEPKKPRCNKKKYNSIAAANRALQKLIAAGREECRFYRCTKHNNSQVFHLSKSFHVTGKLK